MQRVPAILSSKNSQDCWIVRGTLIVADLARKRTDRQVEVVYSRRRWGGRTRDRLGPRIGVVGEVKQLDAPGVLHSADRLVQGAVLSIDLHRHGSPWRLELISVLRPGCSRAGRGDHSKGLSPIRRHSLSETLSANARVILPQPKRRDRLLLGCKHRGQGSLSETDSSYVKVGPVPEAGDSCGGVSAIANSEDRC